MSSSKNKDLEKVLSLLQSTNEVNFSVQWNILLVKYFQNDCDNIMTKISDFFSTNQTGKVTNNNSPNQFTQC